VRWHHVDVSESDISSTMVGTPRAVRQAATARPNRHAPMMRAPGIHVAARWSVSWVTLSISIYREPLHAVGRTPAECAPALCGQTPCQVRASTIVPSLGCRPRRSTSGCHHRAKPRPPSPPHPAFRERRMRENLRGGRVE
jgi:hypothetical protein